MTQNSVNPAIPIMAWLFSSYMTLTTVKKLKWLSMKLMAHFASLITRKSFSSFSIQLVSFTNVSGIDLLPR